MEPPRIKLTRLELVQKLFLGVTIAFARQRSTAAGLLNPRESEAAERSRDSAARRLADYLANDFEISKHEVTRPAIHDDGEVILARLLQSKASRDQSGDQ